MSQWIAVAQVSDCPPGASLEVIAGDRIVALFNIDGTIFALDGICPHQGGPLGQGSLEGNVMTCPWHGWQFNVCTGQHQLSSKITQPRLPVRIEDGTILVDCADGDREQPVE